MKVKMNNSPQEVQIISLILKTQGVEEVEPAVIPMLIEYSNHFVSNILKKGSQFNNLVRTDDIPILNTDDITLAIESIKEESLPIPPCRQYISEMANHVNNKPLKVLLDEGIGVVQGRGNLLSGDFVQDEK